MTETLFLKALLHEMRGSVRATVVVSGLADRLQVQHSVGVQALRLAEAAGLLQTTSRDRHGTVVHMVDPLALAEAVSA